MDYRRGAPPFNDRVRSQDAQAAQQSQVTSGHQAGHEMDVDSFSNQDGVNSANSGANNHSQVENQSEGQHLHTHPFVHRPRGQYSQRRTHNVQSRSGPGNSRKRAYEPDYSYADVYLSADQREQRMGVRRLPFVGEFLQQEPHDKVNLQYNGPQYKDQLELMGGDQSSINWFAPDRQSKSIYGHQFVAKVATDDESLMALVKTIQLEARRQGSPIVNLWMQCQDPNEQRKLSKTPPVVGHTYNDLAVSYNTSIQRCTACGKAGHRVRHCPTLEPVHFSTCIEPPQGDRDPNGRFKIEPTEAPASVAQAVGGVPARPPNSADAAVEKLEPHDRSVPVVVKTEAEPVTLKIEARPVKIKTESQPVRIKAEPDTEGSGITVPTEHVTVTTRPLQILDDDDDEVDPADYIIR